ncbi:NAD(P)/FAD-dependent oxidoreductase [Xylanibacillus composti]|uniref:Ferredoxin--NADP reductase n=1 Tax=Xylanibacillus composti TaxID=1572762 RepID=A0A8J4M246_9BACL|nr:NAD(P)/FAD-dependent oxidoreductase [Xylanibacillus composti]MDT9724901.1 NAD(P)/FAD-dependent oxidoreductase [Xylanibacillus composti]GIQ68136.1 ferredoxin--NADP reductase 1 [Xylanibacillus composti]
MNPEHIYDVTVIGGGPAGLYAAFYSGLREMKTKIIEYQPQLGGKLHVYPEKMIWDVGGLTPLPGAKLLEQLVSQGLTFDPTVVLGEKVEAIQREPNGLFVLPTASGQLHYSRTVIVAIGSGILNPHKLEIEGAERFEITNLNYTVKSLKQFKDKVVLVSGGGNTAVDWANELLMVARKVIVVHRKEAFSGHEAQVKQLLNSKAECLLHTTITKLIAGKSHERIEQVQLTNKQTGEVFALEVDEVVINHGYDRDSSLLDCSELPIERKDGYYIAGNAKSESSIEGLYAAGDILSYEGKVHLIAGAFQDAANAVNRAKQFLEPGAGSTAMVSSHNERFAERNRALIRQLMR